MAITVSDIKSAAAQAACFTCLPVNVQRAIKTYLLARVAGASTDPKTIMAAARGFIGLPPGTQLAIQAYAASVLSGAASASDFVKSQACAFECTPAGMALPIAINQLAGRAGVSAVPKTLAALAKSFIGLPPGYLSALNTFLMAVIAGTSTNAATAAKQAACFACLPPANLENITTLIWTNVALPAPLGFSVVVNADGSADVTWGTPPTGTGYTAVYISFACDYSFVLYTNVAAPGTTIHIPGIFGLTPGICIEIRSCTAAGLCSPPVGTGTQGGGGSTTPPTPTGFGWALRSDHSIIDATWDIPPAGVTSTELWTSTDNITFALEATITAPGAATTSTAPAPGGTKYGKIRYCNATTCGNFSLTLSATNTANPLVTAWLTNITNNGGAPPSDPTSTAINTLCYALDSCGITAKIMTMAVFVPDSLIAAITPIIVSTANPWTNANFVAGDLTINGLTGNGGAGNNKSLTPGVTVAFAGAFLTATQGCFFCYAYNANTSALGTDSGGNDGASINDFNTNLNFAGFQTMDDLFGSGCRLSVNTPGNGFYVFSRIASNDNKIYFANSITAWSSIASNGSPSNGLSTAGNVIFALNTSGVFGQFSNATLSCAGFCKGLTSAEGQCLYNAIQACRVALGGGFR